MKIKHKYGHYDEILEFDDEAGYALYLQKAFSHHHGISIGTGKELFDEYSKKVEAINSLLTMECYKSTDYWDCDTQFTKEFNRDWYNHVTKQLDLLFKIMEKLSFNNGDNYWLIDEASFRSGSPCPVMLSGIITIYGHWYEEVE